ncbi:MAG: AraC family transcriptional regulator [Aquabacterium sp.]|uniref:AraC family transcriptional regulator n=1 Tax=Aquabacterium sp. TaxID=1872578 RepID=UPI002721D01F|nr:AraC family transcriptional regulator [Aquabacterium sp.]MDO9004901.1 AraC family transcriptional regulator [Aquabacterium sp.]
MHNAALPLHYVRLIADMLSGMGVNVPEVLAAADLQMADLADGHRGLGFVPFLKLMHAALGAAKEPALGLLVGERLRINTHGRLGYAALSSSTLRQVVSLLESFLPLRTTLVTVTQRVQGDEVWVGFPVARPLDGLDLVVSEAILLTIKNLIDQITLGTCQVRRVCFKQVEPAYADLARDMFGCEVRYSQDWCGLVLPDAAMDLPLSSADPASFDDAARLCREELDKRDVNAALSIQVRRNLLTRQHGFPSLQVVARQFHLTPRTLHRRLVAEGTSFQQILDEVREHLAMQYLQAGKLSVQEIAYTLGYNDPANFRRAFKRWTGRAPSTLLIRPCKN